MMDKPLVTSLRRRASRGTSGKRMFVEGGDGRSAWALRWKDLILAHVAGGPNASLSSALSFKSSAA
jgi:hypothetical protein